MDRPAAACTLALALALAACGGDSTGPARLPPALVGQWVAGSSCKAAGCLISALPQGSTTPIVLTDQAGITLHIDGGGLVQSTVRLIGFDSATVQGLARTSGGNLIIDYPGIPSDTIAYSFQDGLLRFAFQNTVNWPVDLNGDGLPERMRLTVFFVRG